MSRPYRISKGQTKGHSIFGCAPFLQFYPYIYWSHPSDLNRRPFDYESNALPTELGWPELSPGKRRNRVSPNRRRPNLRIYGHARRTVKQIATS